MRSPRTIGRCRAVARSRISGVQRGSRPFAGAWGRPQSLFLPRPQGAKKLCNSPAGRCLTLENQSVCAIIGGRFGRKHSMDGAFAEPLRVNSRRCKMIFFDGDRPSDSPFVERVWRCHSEGATPFLSIAASNCELVVSRLGGKVTMTVRGPETRATPLGDCPGDGEWLGILLKLGTFLPHFPTRTLVDGEVNLPVVSGNSFWL